MENQKTSSVENAQSSGRTQGVGSGTLLGKSEKAAIERQMHYLCEVDARISEIKNRIRCAKHFLRRREREYAKEELLHVIGEARKLRLHLEAWDNYVISSPSNPVSNAVNETA